MSSAIAARRTGARRASPAKRPTRKRYRLHDVAAYHRKPFWLCADCRVHVGEAHEWFTVHDAVWEAGGLAPDGGVLCVACLEARLGRRLVRRDFPSLRLQASLFYFSPRLRRRMGLPAARPLPPPERVKVGDVVAVCDLAGETGETVLCTVLGRDGNRLLLEVANELSYSRLRPGDVIRAGLRHLLGAWM